MKMEWDEVIKRMIIIPETAREILYFWHVNKFDIKISGSGDDLPILIIGNKKDNSPNTIED